jgi:hypothetical protein
VRPEGLGKLENIHLIETRSRDLLVCSIVSQPLRYRVPPGVSLYVNKYKLGEGARFVCYT